MSVTFSCLCLNVCMTGIQNLPTRMNNTRGVARGVGGPSAPSVRSPAPLESPQMKCHFVQGSMESHHWESRLAPPPLSPQCLFILKSGNAPEKDMILMCTKCMVVKRSPDTLCQLDAEVVTAHYSQTCNYTCKQASNVMNFIMHGTLHP